MKAVSFVLAVVMFFLFPLALSWADVRNMEAVIFSIEILSGDDQLALEEELFQRFFEKFGSEARVINAKALQIKREGKFLKLVIPPGWDIKEETIEGEDIIPHDLKSEAGPLMP